MCNFSSEGSHRIDPLTAPLDTIQMATFTTLTFTSQKSSVRGEVIGLGRSGKQLLCPLLAIVRRINHLRQHNAPPATPLAVYVRPGNDDITTMPLPTSLQCPAPLTPLLGHHSVSSQKTSQLDRFERGGQWPCCVCTLTLTQFVSLDDGAATKCSAIFTFKRNPSCATLRGEMLIAGAFRLLPSQDVPMF